jgi:hypothetical protein
MYDGIHRVKPWVKSGISPFGVGRPDRRPPGVTGFSQYDKLYADVEQWMEKGWLDYLAPQLYWKIETKAQPFGVLLDYWLRQNPRHRHVWPGLYTSRIDDSPKSWEPGEITRQITLTRERDPGRGEIHFSMVSLLQNRKGIADQLRSGQYASAALVPPTPWLDDRPPSPPTATATATAGGAIEVAVHPGAGEPAATFAVWARYGGRDWRFFAFPTRATIELGARSPSGALERIVVSAVDRVGNESARIRLVGPWPLPDRSLPDPRARSIAVP